MNNNNNTFESRNCSMFQEGDKLNMEIDGMKRMMMEIPKKMNTNVRRKSTIGGK